MNFHKFDLKSLIKKISLSKKKFGIFLSILALVSVGLTYTRCGKKGSKSPQKPAAISTISSPTVQGNLIVTKFNDNSVSITWSNAVDKETRIEKLKYFACISDDPIQVNEINNCLQKAVPIANTSQTSFTHDWQNLKRGQVYHFNVVVEDEANNKVSYNSVSQKTTLGVKPLPGIIHPPTSISSNSFRLDWTMSIDGQSPSDKLSYGVCISDKREDVNAQNCFNQLREEMFLNTLYDELSGLEADTTYYYSVLVEDPEGNFDLYPIGNFKTLIDLSVSPGVVEKVTDITKTSLTLNWTEAKNSNGTSDNLEYYICQSDVSQDQINSTSKCLSENQIMDWTPNITSLKLENLTEDYVGHFNILVRDIKKPELISIYGAFTATTLLSEFISKWQTNIKTTYNSSTYKYENLIDNNLTPDVTINLNNSDHPSCSGKFEINIDWGDGTKSIITDKSSPDLKHIYSQHGVYQIKIQGLLNCFTGISNGNSKLIEILQWGGSSNLASENVLLRDFVNLKKISATDLPNFEYRKTLSSFFHGCYSLNFVNSIENWDVSKIENMSYMFFAARTFNQNIGSWNVSNVTNMSGMFYYADAFNQNIGSWNVSKVTNMSSMFNNANYFNQDIGNWNVSNVTNMSFMFSYAWSFNQNIGNWNVSNVTNMKNMFYSALNFNQYIGNWNVSNVTNLEQMFAGAIRFNQNIGNWNVSNVTNMFMMFDHAYAFNQDLTPWLKFKTSLNKSDLRCAYSCLPQ
jgi:surface protein